MKKEKFCIYQMITDLIVKRLEEGVIPWKMPWNESGIAPQNLVSRKTYRGINYWLLISHNYAQPFFLTFRQAAELGGKVKKGAHGHPVVFWKRLLVEDPKTNEDKIIPMLRYYRVFNVADVEGIDFSKFIKPVETYDFDPIESCENMVNDWEEKPPIFHDAHGAYYLPGKDEVHMPNQELFHSPEEYYSTLFHELVHSTGHESRLDRHKKFPNHRFGSQDYSQEELVAEMGAAFLCGANGIENTTIDNSAAYIKGWLSKLKNDKRILINAAGHAQKAADLIRNEVFQEA